MRRSRARGFTLLEFLIAMVITVILVAVAVPQFALWRQRTLRAEAKVNLATLYSTQKGYFAAHETYSDDLVMLGFRPEGEPRFIYGFTSDGLPGASGRNDTAELCSVPHCTYSVAAMVDAFGMPLSAADLPNANVEKLRFSAAAVGNLDNDAVLDVWRVNDVGVWTHLFDDL